MISDDPGAFLVSLLDRAVAVAKPAVCLPPALKKLPAPSAGRTLILGAGKAAAAMAQTVETAWPNRDLEGLVVTRYGHAAPCRRIEVVEAAHPVPDAAGVDAAERMLALADGAGPEDRILFLMSGGASALLSAPLPPLTLEEKQAVTRSLLAAGADIHEINTVRKHLSAIKGGRLAAAAHPARLVTLAISDVVGDDPGTIGSGPTVADPTTREDARAVVRRHGLDIPETVGGVLDSAGSETVKPDDPALSKTEYSLIATPRQSLEAVDKWARKSGTAVEILGDGLTGEARSLGHAHAGLVRRRLSDRADGPRLILSGGEATVALKASGKTPGKGGPNTEYLLALAQGLNGAPGVWALAADTDGADGSEDNAGAVIGPDTLARAAGLGLQPSAFLADNDAWSFFDVLGDLVVTGPTHTNVNDFRAILLT